MGQEAYIIQYNSVPNIERASRKTIGSYIDHETAEWLSFLAELPSLAGQLTFQIGQVSHNGASLAKSLDQLGKLVDDAGKFNSFSRASFRRSNILPPPSESVEGRLVLGLYHTGRSQDAVAAYFRYAAIEAGVPLNRNGPEVLRAPMERGELLIAAAHAASVVPGHKVVSDGLRSARVRATAVLKALDGTVGEAVQVNAQHGASLRATRDRIGQHAMKLRAIFVGAERGRTRNYRAWRSEIELEVERRFAEADIRIARLDRLAEEKQKKRDDAFEALKDLFYTQLRLRAPVALWEERAKSHRARASKALRNFWIAAVVAVILGLGVPWLAGDYIADSFAKVSCLPGKTPSCSRVFSAKGPLTVAGVLLMTSLILWATKMQYRIFLSERHLSLDADEKRAFAETFMALKEDTTVDPANETIVLTSLFRPMQDGITKDGDGGFDLSAAALLAKQMAR